MDISLDEVISWLIVGALAGSLAGMLVKGRREGFGRLLNLAIGLIGALVGGCLFKILRINLGLLGEIKITSQAVVAALVGSLICLGIIWAVRAQWNKSKGTAAAPKS